ncbi:ATP-dependent DNA helicase Rep [Thalassocella blandensis]|nr:ATP-dependent DNA helicase Rep [Thalassocella blandensis]
MAEIIPGLTREVLSRMTSGEKRLAQRLKDLLEDDYLCWYDIPLGRKQRYPDFIILHPGRGLLFLEVKDWKPSSVKKINKEQVELHTEQGLKTVPNPFVQVRQYAFNGINLLQRDPLLQAEGQYQGKLVMPYGWGVVFTSITRSQIEKSIPEEHRQNLLPDHLTLYKDEMTDAVDAESFQERLWGMFNYRFPEKLTVPQINRIRWHLFPEVRINAPVQASFLDDPLSEEVPTIEQIPEIVRIMDIQQEQLARSLGEGHRVIHGVAGSGKTLILGYRAQLLAQTSNKPVLILCFNTTLAAKLRSFIVAKGISEQVQVYHFHDWCGLQLKTYHVAVAQGEASYWEREVTSVIDAVDKEQIPRAQYGAVLIDEGHDFEAEWLKLVVQMIDPDSNSLLLLYDDAQSIYKKKSGLGFTLSSVGIQAVGRTSILRLNYRNTREILDFAYRFAKDFFTDSASSDDFHVIEPEAAGTSGAKPVVHQLQKWQQEVEYCVECLQAWHKQGMEWRDMGVIYVAGYQGKAVSLALKQAGIPNLWMASKNYKKSYDPMIDRVNVLTIQSSKGLEFNGVVMVGLGQLKQDDLARDAKLLYVGMTRAQRELHLCMSAANAICDRIANIG